MIVLYCSIVLYGHCGVTDSKCLKHLAPTLRHRVHHVHIYVTSAYDRRRQANFLTTQV